MAISFFAMLFTLGVGSAVGVLSNITTNLKDYFPKLKYWQLALVSAIGGFLIGLVYVTRGGFHILGLVDHFGGQFLVFVLAVVELLGVVWIYGLENFCWDIEFMLKRKVSPFWRISWYIVMPFFLLTMCFYWAIKMSKEELTYGENKLAYPTTALTFGWTLFIIGLGQVMVAVVYVALQKREKISSTMKYLISPNPEWGPKNNSDRSEWVAFKLNKLKEREQIVRDNEHSWIQQKFYLVMAKYP